jgi:RING finger and CHY zinc finger domain-containing protein 1
MELQTQCGECQGFKLNEKQKTIPRICPVPTSELGRELENSSAVLRCQHYIRGAAIFAACCQQFYPCRQCHDEDVDGGHEDLQKGQVTKVKCLHCKLEQHVADACINKDCQERFGDRVCLDCRLFDSTPDREFFHCDKCGICRLGRKEENFHCERCDTCVKASSRGRHTCIASPLRDAKCPICLCSMFYSSRPSCFLPCGHAMHTRCFDDYARSDYRCPLCYKSMADMHSYNSALDKIMLEELANGPESQMNTKVRIFCNDCGETSQTRYHFEFFKCNSNRRSTGISGPCGSYNTRFIEYCK